MRRIQVLTINCLICFLVFTTLTEMVTAQQSPALASPGVILATDTDCVVALDDKVVGRVQKDHKEFFPGSEGKHVLSAATDSGDYWEQGVEISAILTPSVAVSFIKVRADRAALEKSVTTLREHVDEQEKKLADSNPAKESGPQLFFQPATLSPRRHSIVEAINFYTDRWGKEMGMRDSRDQTSQNLNDAFTQQTLSNLGTQTRMHKRWGTSLR